MNRRVAKIYSNLKDANKASTDPVILKCKKDLKKAEKALDEYHEICGNRRKVERRLAKMTKYARKLIKYESLYELCALEHGAGVASTRYASKIRKYERKYGMC